MMKKAGFFAAHFIITSSIIVWRTASSFSYISTPIIKNGGTRFPSKEKSLRLFRTTHHRHQQQQERQRQEEQLRSSSAVDFDDKEEGEEAKEDEEDESMINFDCLVNKRILVVGGSGRVGGSVVTQLLLRGVSSITVGGTQKQSLDSSKERWCNLYPQLSSAISERVHFVKLQREDADSIRSVLMLSSSEKYDLVIHTAGPFQGKVSAPNGVIAAAIDARVPYLDVCDDYCTAMATKTNYASKAVQNAVPCIISTGCWPGVSSLMAKQLVYAILSSANAAADDNEVGDLSLSDFNVQFNFFTAGSGGAGATLLVATFLILAEKALTIVNGRRTQLQPMKDYERVNFGDIVGDKDIAPLNLLEVASIHDVLGIGNVKSLFGTAPSFWNALLGFMAQLPSSLLANETIMSKLALFSLPIVRIVDYFAGATNAMRVDVTTTTITTTKGKTTHQKNNLHATAIYAHENLEPCVGECVVSFAAALLTNNKRKKKNNVVPNGVWFPEEAIDHGKDASAILAMASIGAHTVDVRGNVKDLTISDVWGHHTLGTNN